MATQIRTNHHWREPVCFHDLPENERADFDYIEDDDRYSPRLFCYRGTWHDVGEFFRIAPMSNGDPHALRPAEGDPLCEWHGYQSDSFSSGVIVRCSDDGEKIQVGRYWVTSE